MTYRLVGAAEQQIDRILIDSARQFGLEAAARYHRLMLAAMEAISIAPDRGGSRAVRQLSGVRAYPLRLARQLLERQHRVMQPRHLMVYRVGSDGVVEILGVLHDRMALTRTARRMQRDAGG